MNEQLSTWLVAVPVGAILGWFANRLLAPTFDELGARLKGWIMARFSKSEYETYVAYSNLHKLILELHTEKGHNSFNARKPFLDNHKINLEIKDKTSTQLCNVAAMWVRQTRVWSYAESDIYFAGLELLLPSLTKDDLQYVFNKYHDDSQASLWPFLEVVEARRSELLAANILQYLRDRQKEWSDILARREEKKKKANI